MAVPIVIAAIAKLSEKTEKSDNSESKSSNIPEKIGSEADLSKAIPDKLDMSLENNTAELSSSIPDKETCTALAMNFFLTMNMR